MARIVSGSQSSPSALEQFAFTHDLFAQNRRDRDRRDQQAFENQLQIQKMMGAMQQARLQSQDILNRQAQGGDVRALQELALRARKDPRQLRTEDAVQLLSGITDEKMRPQAIKAVGQLFDEEDRHEKFQAAEQMLQQASESQDLFQPEQIQDWASRLQAKRAGNESPDDVMSEIMQVRQKVGEDATNANENTEALAQAEQVVQSLPRGSFERRQAEIALNSVLGDEAGMKRQGTGARTLKAVQTAAIGPRAGFEERQQEQADARPAPGLGGMTTGERNKQMLKEPTLGFGGPEIPPYTGGTRATQKGLKSGTIKPSGAAKKKPNPKSLAQELAKKSIGSQEAFGIFEQRGFDMTDPSVLEEIKMAMQEARRASGG